MKTSPKPLEGQKIMHVSPATGDWFVWFYADESPRRERVIAFVVVETEMHDDLGRPFRSQDLVPFYCASTDGLVDATLDENYLCVTYGLDHARVDSLHKKYREKLIKKEEEEKKKRDSDPAHMRAQRAWDNWTKEDIEMELSSWQKKVRMCSRNATTFTYCALRSGKEIARIRAQRLDECSPK